MWTISLKRLPDHKGVDEEPLPKSKGMGGECTNVSLGKLQVSCFKLVVNIIALCCAHTGESFKTDHNYENCSSRQPRRRIIFVQNCGSSLYTV